MHKSKTTFVLLMSTMVMLAAMPLLTNNGITMASATGNDNNYKDDSYGDYPKDDSYGDYPKDDSYGDYPKDDSYGDYSKDHSYGDYSKDTSYSTYPPHDMKGDKGQKGDKGDRGDKGKSGGSINKFSIYTNLGPIVNGSVPMGQQGIDEINSTATCDPGDTAISGSFKVRGSADIRFDQPLPTEDGWFAGAVVAGTSAGPGSQGSVQADVVCFDNAKPPHDSKLGISLSDLFD